MKTLTRFIALFLFSLCLSATAQDFSKSTIDFAVVVSDVEKSIEFYTKVIGFEKVGSFKVSAQKANDAGLTSSESELTIYTLKLAKDKTATTLKLMEIKDAKRGKPANDYIHSSLGMSYMTIFVTDTKTAIARAAKFGHKPIAKGTVDLEFGNMFLTVLKDPDGNFIELVGPGG